VFVNRASFNLVAGAEAIATYKPEAPYKYDRCFCSRCGSSLGEITSTNESFPMPANCFDEGLNLTNQFHVFVKDKPTWHVIGDEAPQFMEYPPSNV
jgi:hypothetical protein